MNYDINLPKSVEGKKLMEALRETASKLKWHYSQSVERFSISQGSVNIKPSNFKVNLRTCIIFGETAEIYNIEPDGKYSALNLYSFSGISRKTLEDFSSTLYEILK